MDNNELERLVLQQSIDKNMKKVKPNIINPTKRKAFQFIKDKIKRAIYILHISGFSERKISIMFNIHRSTVSYWISQAREKHRSNLPQ